MITLKQHIKLNKGLSEGNEIDEVFKELNVAERINILRNIENVYPITRDVTMDDSFKDKFTVYDNVMDLHLGQFIMLEQVITGKEKYDFGVDNDMEIAKLIIRPKEHKDFDNEDAEIEERNTNDILNASVTDVYSAVYKYMDHREFVLFKQFAGVFYSVSDYDEEEEEEKEELIGEDLFNNQWYWYNIVRMLAQEDIRRYSEIYMLKMSVVLPEMSYLAQKSKIEQARQRKQEMASKL